MKNWRFKVWCLFYRGKIQARIKKGFGFYGEHKELTKMIKAEMTDPNSFELVACNWFDMDDHIVVIQEYRGRNQLGGMAVESVKAKCGLDGEVLQIMNVKQMR
jgi:hypothetical protein